MCHLCTARVVEDGERRVAEDESTIEIVDVEDGKGRAAEDESAPEVVDEERKFRQQGGRRWGRKRRREIQTIAFRWRSLERASSGGVLQINGCGRCWSCGH